MSAVYQIRLFWDNDDEGDFIRSFFNALEKGGINDYDVVEIRKLELLKKEEQE